MSMILWPGSASWPLWQRIFFRFLFVYILLYIAPWTWIEYIPGGDYVTKYYYQLQDWAVNGANKHLFHQYKVLVPFNGSGDTSYGYTQFWLFLLLASLVCICWSLIDRRSREYNRAAYWLRICMRYFLIISCFSYGFAKIFLLQMPFPGDSLLSTTLGDLLPMRLSWVFMGASPLYEFFSGLMEVAAGLLLLFRRTATAGALLSTGVFANVFLMNLGYDIPVKLFSAHLLVMSLVLLAFEYRRIIQFFLTNRNTTSGNLYDVRFPAKWMRITKIILKLAFIFFTFIMPFHNSYKRYKETVNTAESKPIRSGIYDVTVFVVNGDTIPPLITDTIRWRDVVFDKTGGGSVHTTDTIFPQRYRRGHFRYTADTVKHEIKFEKRNPAFETFYVCTLQYEMPDSNHILLKGKIRNDSVYAELKRSNRHFQLKEKQFHWLSEYNR
jgi:hypothetical protein